MRTVLFDWLAARKTGGQFVLRIEDTDQNRLVQDAEKIIFDSLHWLGLQWDEGPEVGGPYGPYVQSQRLDLYHQHAELLVEKGAAYWCDCTPERLEQMRAALTAAKRPPRYDRRCLPRQEEVIAAKAAGGSAVLRQLVPPGRTEWDDGVHGLTGFDNKDVDDSVLIKSDGFPTYHLAVVVDDHLMKISHVIRADEWVSSTPKHLLMYQAFGWDPPVFIHVPNVLGNDHRKLSKRDGAQAVLEFKDLGYLPQALINYMALLGWSPGTEEEFFSPQQLIELFSVERIQNAPGIFDPQKLDAVQAWHMRNLSEGQLTDALTPWLPNMKAEQIQQLLPLLRERIVTLKDAQEMVQPLISDVVVDGSELANLKGLTPELCAKVLEQTSVEVEGGGLDDPTAMRERLTSWLEPTGTKARDGFRAIYVAIYGKSVGLPIFDAMAFIGKERSLQRLQAAKTALASVAI
jgi:glutamyl-tRNA synthetase